MSLPFTTAEFLGVFERYNTAIWPLQVAAYVLGLTAVALVLRPGRRADRLISAILTVLWLWNGIAYHWLFFRSINPAADVFGALFVVQGLIWLWEGVYRQRLSFQTGSDSLSTLGGLLILYAMVVYPIVGTLLGHGYPRSPSFGVAPCPTTIFTFGLLLWTRPGLPKYVLAIPLIWAMIATGAAMSLGIPEDFGLPAAGALGTTLLVWRDSRATGSSTLRGRHARQRNA